MRTSPVGEICPNSRFATAGFSLFELLVVLVIIGLAAAVVAPRTGGSVEKLQLRTAANDLAAVLRFARSRAVTRGRDHAVYYQPATRMFAVFPAAAGGDRVSSTGRRDGQDVPPRYRLPEGLRLESEAGEIPVAEERIEVAIFYALGNSTVGTVVLADGDERIRRINIDPITGAAIIIP